MAEITQTISEIPTPPSTSDPETFDARADAFLASLGTLDTELNTFATQANALSTDANAAKDDAETAQTASEAARDIALSAQTSSEAARDTATYVAAAVQSAAGLPALVGKAGRALKVTADEQAVEWGLATTVETFTSSGTWTKPANATTVVIELLGAGAGGTSDAYSGIGEGGGGGQYCRHIIPAAALGATESVIVGAGGAGVTASSAGNPGGDSCFADFCARGGGTAAGEGPHVGGGYGVWPDDVTSFSIALHGMGSSTATLPSIDGGACGSLSENIDGGDSYFGGPGGGASAPGTSQVGSDGGNVISGSVVLVAGGATGEGSGNDGADGADAPPGRLAGSGGGGGKWSFNLGTGGGNGGNGGPGAGGGGATRFEGQTVFRGGDGGDGRVRITTF